MPRPTDRLTLTSRVPAPAPASGGSARLVRPWISMHWRCCGVYSRIYRHPSSDRYRGTCPKCSHPVTLHVAPGGTPARAFSTG